MFRLLYVVFLLTNISTIFANIEMEFIIDKCYLIGHTLNCTNNKTFSSDKWNDDIVSFQNEVWEKNEIGYRLLPSERMNFDTYHHETLLSFMQFAESLPTFQKILEQMVEYKNECEKKWINDYEITSKYISDLTGLTLDKKFKIYLTHPSQRNGCYIGDNCICWGCSSNKNGSLFDHYDVIYLWHEILHSYFSNDDLSHCIIQLITDNGLRVMLNQNEKIFPLVGHDNLMSLMRKIYPKWEEYLQRKDKNIYQFLEELKSLGFSNVTY